MSANLKEDIDIAFIALTVYREARGESDEGKLAVAFSIMQRVKHPAWWGNDALDVVFHPYQYSSMTVKGDPNLTVWPRSDDPAWQACINAAVSAYYATQPNPAPEADSYFDCSIKPPYWTEDADFIACIGRLRFYRTLKV
jgi:N-acetylmuramoyl-L-alanine amidase